jgi:hypothetical protein
VPKVDLLIIISPKIIVYEFSITKEEKNVNGIAWN